MSFLISSWYSSAFVFFFFFLGRGPAAGGAERRRAAGRARAMVIEVASLSWYLSKSNYGEFW